ncbi:MAG TPA: TIGR01777 family oxidoreductase [Phycisphaerae bacterium]|nr:TIGR01777 family oxidoreductase [Phycisphaerae bacterium]
MTNQPFRIAITGPSGLIGSRLAADLRTAGHTVYPLRRATTSTTNECTWNPDTGQLSTPEPPDILLHLAGRSVATRWTAKAKSEIYNSRVPATEKLAQHLATLPRSNRPKLLLSTSAVGIYGNRGDELLTESSPPAPPKTSFLADVCRAWEAATQPAEAAGIPTLHLRFGVVLAKSGGALAKMLLPTKLGLAGPIGPATQFLPWISLTDLSRLIQFLIAAPLTGPLNIVAPNPVRQHEFIRTLATLLHRPALFPMPTPLVKLAFGQMGQEMLLASQRVISTRLPADFHFLHPTLESALRAELA